jgi:hypothetical protein
MTWRARTDRENTPEEIEQYEREERQVNNRLMVALAGFLDPRTRADEVRVVRAKSGMPPGMPVRPDLERKRPTGTPSPADEPAA